QSAGSPSARPWRAALGPYTTPFRSFKCTWPDNYTGESVSAQVTDKDGGVGSDSKSVDVANVAPTVHLSGTNSANEGDTKHYSYSWTDPGSADTFPRHSVGCGVHGTASNSSFDATGQTGSFDCTWSDDSGAGTADVSASVSDDDGGTGSDTIHVAVANVAPTATFGNDGPVDEGSSFQDRKTTRSEAASDDQAAGFTYAFDCGDGSGYGAFSASASATCPTNDNGVRNVKGKNKAK